MRKLLSFSTLATIAVLFCSSSVVRAQHGDQQHQQHHEDQKETVVSKEDINSVDHVEEEGEFDPQAVIMHHIQDSHSFHIYGEGEDAVSVPLPVILWTDQGLVTFMSSAFHHDNHGHHVVEANGQYFVNYHEDIYEIPSKDYTLEMNEEGYPKTGASIGVYESLDFSITKNVFSLFVAGTLLMLIFGTAASKYKKSGHRVPRGLASFVEPLVIFVRDDIAIPQLGGRKAERFMPFLLTMFFLIWIINLMGLIPVFPFSANLSGNIAFTLGLSFIALIVVNFSGNKYYWKHIFAPNPWWLWPILFPIEFASNVVIKFFALMIRLFANITAGHIIVLSLISLIFIFQSVAAAAVSVPFALFISVLELLVAALQAFIFTLLTALFLGQAVADDHH